MEENGEGDVGQSWVAEMEAPVGWSPARSGQRWVGLAGLGREREKWERE